MLYVSRIIVVCLLLSLAPGVFGQGSHSSEVPGVAAKVHVAGQNYCRADADLFSVSMHLDIVVANSSKVPIYLSQNMIPWVAKVAKSAHQAKEGRYLFENARSQYPQDSRDRKTKRLEPGREITLQVGYDLVARYKAGFKYPKSLAPGTYAVVLVLKPEVEPEHGGEEILQTLSTEPFIVKIPRNPSVMNCENTP